MLYVVSHFLLIVLYITFQILKTPKVKKNKKNKFIILGVYFLEKLYII